ITPPCEPRKTVPCSRVPSKASRRSASTYRVSPERLITWMWWPPCPNSTVPLPSTVIRGVASPATRRPIIDRSPPCPPVRFGVKLTSPWSASIAPRWLNRRRPGVTTARIIFELISSNPMSHVPRDRVPLTGLHVDQPVALEADLERLAAALAEHRAERHTGLQRLPQVPPVGHIGARVDGQRVLRADPQHHR